MPQSQPQPEPQPQANQLHPNFENDLSPTTSIHSMNSDNKDSITDESVSKKLLNFVKNNNPSNNNTNDNTNNNNNSISKTAPIPLKSNSIDDSYAIVTDDEFDDVNHTSDLSNSTKKKLEYFTLKFGELENSNNSNNNINIDNTTNNINTDNDDDSNDHSTISNLPEFRKRPPNDTPVISEASSPVGVVALSPMDLSDCEEDDNEDDSNSDNNEDKEDHSNNDKPNQSDDPLHSPQLLKDTKTVNTADVAQIPFPLPASSSPPSTKTTTHSKITKHRTTLDIPGQTRSKQSPDGKIVNTNERVVVVMIGLPARGKSYLSNKLVRYLNWLQINARLFNVGSTRRKESSQLGPEHSPLPDDSNNNSKISTANKIAAATAAATTTTGSSIAPPREIQSNSKENKKPPPTTTHRASFFSPDNKDSIKLREKWAKDTLNNLLDYLLKGDGCVGIFDATNSTKARRKMIYETIMERSSGQLKVLFLESICNDQSIIEDNVRLKLQGPDYKNMDPNLALKDFVGRLKNYEKAYETIDEDEEKLKNFQFVKMIDVGRKVIACNIKGFLASQIIYYLLNFNLNDRQIWITRHGESTDNVLGKIGGDANITERGLKFSKALKRFMCYQKEEFNKKQLKKFKERLFIKKKYSMDLLNEENNSFNDTCNDDDNSDDDNTDDNDSIESPPEEASFSVWTSMLQRSIQTVQDFPEELFDIKEMKMLDELGAGKCDGMTYEEIQQKFPQDFKARLENKMSYRYPGMGGESYLDVISRLKPVITEVERTTNHILIVTHRVVARVLLSYFLNLNKESIGELDIPLHVIYLFEPNPFGVEWSMYEYDEKTDWFHKVNPEQLENSKKVKQIGISFKERRYSVIPTAPRRYPTTSSSSSSANSNLNSLPFPSSRSTSNLKSLNVLTGSVGVSADVSNSGSSNSSSKNSDISSNSNNSNSNYSVSSGISGNANNNNNNNNIPSRFSNRSNTNAIDDLHRVRGTFRSTNNIPSNLLKKQSSGNANNTGNNNNSVNDSIFSSELEQKLNKLSIDLKKR
ncbi:kinase activity protein [[Candida] boidinii]|nr:kinase activity protein [[Candida] boidinii]